MNWVYSLENKIFTIIEYRTKQVLGKKYPSIFFTQDAEPDDTKNNFPTIYLHFLPSAETGRDLRNDGTHAIVSTVQIEVTCSKDQKQSGARQIMWEVVEQFKKLSYSIMLTPEVLTTGNDTHQVVARVSRVIGASDSIG